jgi:hypothetical protein
MSPLLRDTSAGFSGVNGYSASYFFTLLGAGTGGGGGLRRLGASLVRWSASVDMDLAPGAVFSASEFSNGADDIKGCTNRLLNRGIKARKLPLISLGQGYWLMMMAPRYTG